MQDRLWVRCLLPTTISLRARIAGRRAGVTACMVMWNRTVQPREALTRNRIDQDAARLSDSGRDNS